MSYSESDTFSGPSFRSWFWILSNLIFSSILLLFVFWTVTTYLLLDNLRLRSAAAAHILLIFDTPPAPAEIQGLKATMEKIAGEGSVSSLQAPDRQSRTGRKNSQRILSVAVSLGRAQDGQTVTLSDQIRSLQQIVKNDTAIKEVVFNPEWVARVDLLAGISERAKKGLEVLGGLLSLGLALYWARVSLLFWSHLFPARPRALRRDPPPRQGSLFQREREDEENFPLPEREEEEKKDLPSFLRIPSAGLWGALAGLVAVFLAFSLRSILYVGSQNPFLPGALGSHPLTNHLWIMGSALGAGLGLAGGVLYLVLPFPSPKREHIRP
ncbi:MAG: hypothetical protein M1537_06540 [Nitrospirae bacterium]|nr:hypothetical protein [Nitrospirota bacterium]MCL5285617.1 hypothetical protein [Nitrospirota bacterium]